MELTKYMLLAIVAIVLSLVIIYLVLSGRLEKMLRQSQGQAMYCPYCGNPLVRDAIHCPKCERTLPDLEGGKWFEPRKRP